jgi:hypothetical protein
MEIQMNKTLQWTIGIGFSLITLAVVFSAVAPVVAPRLGWSAYPVWGGYGPGMMGGFGQGMMGGYRQGAPGGYGPGMMNGYGQGMMSDYNEGMMRGYSEGMMGGPLPASMHKAMLDALAEKMKLPRADLDKRLAAGETILQIATSQGISATDFSALMLESQKSALAKAVADGYLTQAQADAMAARMSSAGPCPFGTAPAARP